MKTDLAYIDESFNSLVDNVSGSTPIPLKNCTTYVGGFAVPDGKKIEAAHRTFQSNNSSYIQDRNMIKGELEKRGVKAKAFIPLRIWQSLCKEHDLFVLSPTPNGNISVRVNPQDIAGPWFGWATLMIVACAFASVCYLTISAYRELGMVDTVFGVFLGSTLLSAIAGAAIGGVTLGMFEQQTARLFLRLHLALSSKKRILLNFLPNFKEEEYNQKVRLVLPTPPQSVLETLAKLTNYPRGLKVAAEAGAINFDRSFYDILAEKSDADIIERRELMRNDPIIYDQCGQCVAVIEQFGDFPIEKEVVDKLINLEFLL